MRLEWEHLNKLGPPKSDTLTITVTDYIKHHSAEQYHLIRPIPRILRVWGKSKNGDPPL